MNSREKQFKDHVGQTSPYPMGIDVESAKGIYIKDKSGKEYMDFISGIAVSNLGHQHPAVIKAVKEQVDKHMHVMVYGEFIQDAQLDLSKELNSITPQSIDGFYFVNSGTEANEAALKLAKRTTGRSKIVSYKGAYHGATHGSLSVSGSEYKKYAVRPLLPNIYHIEFNNIDELEVIDAQTACVIVEPIQGDAGVRIPDLDYMRALREKCSSVGALLIFDEIQTGLGRTGSWFAFEHFNIVPDMITVAKALGGGMPIGALCAPQSMLNNFTFDPVLGHITTFGGHPVNCAAAAANIKAIKAEISFEQVEMKGQQIEEALVHPEVVEIRRKGLFFAIELESPEKVQKVVEYCLEHGLITFWFLSCPESFRIAPPLNVSFEEIEKASSIINSAFSEI